MAKAGSPEIISRYIDFTGGLQTQTSRLLQKDNELNRSENARYSVRLGGITRRQGYEALSDAVSIGNPVKGLNSFFQKDGNFKIISNAGANVYFENGSQWSSFYSSLPSGSQIDYENFLNKTFGVGYSATLDTYAQMFTIDGSMTASTSIDVFGAPRAKYLMKYNDRLYAANCWVDGVKYPNRVYVSSSPTDVITYINGDQKSGAALQIYVDSVRYLKAGMSVDIYGENSNVKKVSALTIVSVDKSKDMITCTSNNIDVKDRDTIHLAGEKGNLHVFWNTDYPSAQESDFIELPPENNEVPVITGIFTHNNRFWIFTEHTRTKWDGGNLVKVSSTVGTTSNASIKEVRNWMVFVNKIGVWAVSDANGAEQLLSRNIQNYIDAINQQSFYSAVAMVVGDEYKLYVGQMSELDDRTTSTSTSSTSTSSTSSSTSSTSTSSTSTSSTSVSTTATTRSTSSSSKSTSTSSTSQSSTSISSSSTSKSTSTSSTSSSTSTTTLTPGIESTVLVYDFAMNAWSVDKIDRSITCAVNHIMNGYEKTYFGATDGRVYRDRVGLTDWMRPIQFMVETKRLHQDLPEETKTYRKAFIYTQNGQNAVASYSIDGGEWKVFGQLDRNITVLNLGDVKGRDISIRVAQNNGGESVVFIGVSVIWLRGEMYGYSS